MDTAIQHAKTAVAALSVHVLPLAKLYVRPYLPADAAKLYDQLDDPQKTLAILVSAAVAIIAPIAIGTIFRQLCNGREKTKPSRDFSAEAEGRLPKEVLVCSACNLLIPLTTAAGASEAVAKHRSGKRHRKALEERKVEDDEHTLFSWDKAVKWEKSSSIDDADDGIRNISASELAARRQKQAAMSAVGAAGLEGIQLLGKGVAIAAAREADPSELNSGDWTRVGSGAGSGGGAAGAGKGSKKDKGSEATSGGDAGAVVSKDILANMLHLEGSRNILEGLVVHNRFLTPGAEAQMLGWIEQSIKAGQGGRLRGQTYSHPRPIPNTSAPGQPPAQSPLTLNYGCYYDLQEHAPVPAKLVEPLPPQLQDLARRIAARGDWLGGTAGGKKKASVPDSATILELLPGQYIAPHIVHASFETPVYMVALCGDEDLLLGLRIDRIAPSAGGRPGDFLSSFCHRFSRRSLLAFRGPAAELTRCALPCVSNRFIVIILRTMGPALRSEMEARGNTVAPA